MLVAMHFSTHFRIIVKIKDIHISPQKKYVAAAAAFVALATIRDHPSPFRFCLNASVAEFHIEKAKKMLSAARKIIIKFP
jgi:hypothetical protein